MGLAAIGALRDRGVSANSTVRVGESFAGSLIGFAEEKNSDLIVIWGARDGVFGGSTAARILAGTDAPVIVVPRDGD